MGRVDEKAFRKGTEITSFWRKGVSMSGRTRIDWTGDLEDIERDEAGRKFTSSYRRM